MSSAACSALSEPREFAGAEGGIVALKAVFQGPYWDRPLIASASLRFMHPAALDAHLEAAGFAVEERFGSWNRTDFDPTGSRSIITIARTS